MTERVEVRVDIVGVEKAIQDIERIQREIVRTEGAQGLSGGYPSLQGNPQATQIGNRLTAANIQAQEARAKVEFEQVRDGEASLRAQKELYRSTAGLASAHDRLAKAGNELANAEERSAEAIRRGELQNVRQAVYGSPGPGGRTFGEAELDRIDARRAAQARVARAASDERLRQLNDPRTSFADRTRLELGGTSGRLTDELRKGFFNIRPPGEAMSLGGSIGQASRFTLLYGSLYSGLRLLTEAVGASAQEVLAYTDALATLEVATGQQGAQLAKLGTQLGGIAANAGFAPSAGVGAGAIAVGAFGAAQAAPEIQAAIAKGTVEVSSRIAAIAGTDIGETTQQLAGVARSLNLTTERLPGLEDELTYVSQQIGRPVGELLSAIAQLGTLGAGAGFTPEELASVIGQVTATTGQTPESASGSFRQVLSRADDPNFQAKIEEQFGIKAVGVSLRDIFAEFAALKPDSEQVNRFSLLFGRGASQQVAQILANQFDAIQSTSANARLAAGTGIGEDRFNTVMNNISGQLRRLGAEALQLGKDLASTGILAAVGLFAKGLLEAIKAVDSLVQLFNEIPGPVREALFLLLEFNIALKAARIAIPFARGGAAGAASVLGLGGINLRAAAATSLGSGFFGRLGGAAFGPAAEAGAHALPAAAAAGLGARIGGLASSAHGALLAINPLALGLGAVAVAAIGFKNNLDQIDRVFASLDENMPAIITARTADEAQAAVEAARQNVRAADQLTNAGVFSRQTLTGQTALNVLGLTGADDAQRQARDQLAYAEQQQRFIDAARNAAKTAPVAAFTDFTSVDSLQASLEVLGSSGYSAGQQVDALIESFQRLAVAGGEATNQVVIHAGEFDQLAASGGAAALLAGQTAGVGGDATGNLQQIVGITLAKGAAQLAGPNGELVLDEAAKARLTQMVDAAILPILESMPEDTREAAHTILMNGLQHTFQEWGAAGTAGSGISAQTISNFLQQGFTAAQAGVGSDTTRLGSAADAQRLQVGRLDALLAEAREKARGLPGGREGAAERAEAARVIEQYEIERKEALGQYVEALNNEGQVFTQLAQSRLASDDAVGRAALTSAQATQDFLAAIGTGNRVLIAQTQAAMNEAAQAFAKAQLERVNAGNLTGIDPRDQTSQLQAQLENAQRTLASQTEGSTEYSQTLVTIAGLQQQITELATSTANAAASAGIAGNQSAIAQATVALDNASRNLADQLPGTVAYYQALGELRQSQYDLAEAEAAYSDTQRRLASDITDPVEQARLDVQAARDKLERDRASGQGPDVIAQDRLDVKRAQASEEQAAFQQRLSDAQTADQLGRTSHAAYLRYLQNEHDRLSAIKNRTRQQQEQLDTIDQALLAAQQSMAGQFNLGDIKVPTPYEVRRYIEATGDGARATAIGRASISQAGGVEGGQTINHISIDGADTAAVERILRQLINGSSIGTATTKTRRKRG